MAGRGRIGSRHPIRACSCSDRLRLSAAHIRVGEVVFRLAAARRGSNGEGEEE